MRKFIGPKALLDRLKKRMEKCRRLVLFLDYDGTLCPIAPRPEDARPGKHLPAILRRIEGTPDLTVAIVTGRPVRSIRNILRLRKSWFAGTHGAEISMGFGRIKVVIDARKARSAVLRIIREIKPHIDSDFSLEDKGISISLHYRLAKPAHARTVRRIFRRIVTPYVRNRILTLVSSKGAVEARPAAANKGLAIDAVLQEAGGSDAFCVAMGDDRTDADMFRKVRQRGVSVSVGGKFLAADFRLAHPGHVTTFLKILIGFWKKKNRTRFRPFVTTH